MKLRSIVAVCALGFVGISLLGVRDSRADIILVSRTQKASSSASNSSGSNSDTQPDQVLGTTLGAFSLSSNSQSPDGLTLGRGSVASDVALGNSDAGGHLMDINLLASSTVGGSGGVGGGTSEAIIVYQFTSAIQLQQTGFLFGPRGYSLFIKNSANHTVYSNPSFPMTLSFTPDTYTFDFEVGRGNNAGNSASEQASVTMTVLPEPAIATVITGAIAVIGAMKRRRRAAV